MSEITCVVEAAPECGLAARAPDVSIYSHADTIECRRNIQT